MYVVVVFKNNIFMTNIVVSSIRDPVTYFNRNLCNFRLFLGETFE